MRGILFISLILLLSGCSEPDKITVKVECNGCEASISKKGDDPVTNRNVKGVWEKGIWCERGSVVAAAAKNVRSSDKIAIYVYLNGKLIDSDKSSGEGALVGAGGHVPKR